MARQRKVQPGYNEDQKVAAMSPWARVVDLLLPCFMDANGVFEDSPRLIKAKVFPLEEHSLKKVKGWIDEIVKAGRMTRYEVDGIGYLRGFYFSKEQKIHMDEPVRYPTPVENPRAVVKHSPNEVPDPPLAGAVNPPSFPLTSSSPLPLTSTLTSPSASPPNPADPFDETEWIEAEAARDQANQAEGA